MLLPNTAWLSLTSGQCFSGLHMVCMALGICAFSRLYRAVHLELYFTQPGAGIYISRSAQYVYNQRLSQAVLQNELSRVVREVEGKMQDHLGLHL